MVNTSADGHQQILSELETLVWEELKVVSFKWLARQYDLSADLAKQLLFSFVEQHGPKVSAIYLLAGWTKQGSHIVQLVGQKGLQNRRAGLKSETSLHVYSIQPSQPKDPAELYNNDLEQSKQLFSALYRQHVANCLSDNRLSAITCTAAKWDPALVSSKVTPPAAVAPSKVSEQAQGQKVAVKEAIDHIMSGKALQAKTGGAASVAVDDDTDGAKIAGTPAAGPAPASATLANERASAHAVSGAAKREALVSGAKRTSGNSGLAAMWSKAPAKKQKAQAASKPAGGRPHAAADANDALRNAAQAEASSSSEEEEEAPAAPVRRVHHGNNKSRRLIEDDEDDAADIEIDVEQGSSQQKQGQKRGSAPAAGKRRAILEESSEDDSAGAPPTVSQPSARGYKAVAEAAKPDAKQPAKKRSKASSRASSAVQGGDDSAPSAEGEGEGEEEEAGADPAGAAKKRQRRSKAEPKYGTVKAGSAPADGSQRRRVLKTSYNDKGEEVTELVWEDNPTTEGKPDETAAGPDDDRNASPPKQSPPKPGTDGPSKGRGTKPAAKPAAADLGLKKGSKGAAKTKGPTGQKQIQSFFAKK